MGGTFHRAAMVDKAVESLMVKPGGIYVDGTLGGGGHAGEILRRSAPDGILIGIDRDDEALDESRRVLASFGERAVLMKGNFSRIKEIIARSVPAGVDGILLDLGVSSHQLVTASRGFSFSLDGPLDMRMNGQDSFTAGDLVNTCPEERLKEIIREYGEEKQAGRIARAIVEARRRSPITTTGQCAALVSKALGSRARTAKIHPATKTFQALRIAVNKELENLEAAVRGGIEMLKPGGRFTVISFHSLEDRIVKNLFREAATECSCPPHFPLCVCRKKKTVTVITGRPVRPDPGETEQNPRARSARLRTVEKV
ncbi:MAG: 16S rRNA (cytosine(1402)-N(4))-methyltransferase RsmH [Syntrophales bacterium]|jgi:16S rRNA (cytosine1402-N4)-methyltransferase|nr:16S rRNA (cytosine(1402)-N(4))-methyltransferase RsmH [Syntrophales bacterium]MCK9528610.1 16S rRNA (cytosine(1402)-N(4))-methyltransferase RsmH [Syntrophales bacterium]MDX9923051.1 16S rRNA (cytosine(1402)-N(4))-methyltransferase RsmH [Syntrophales bacterium]